MLDKKPEDRYQSIPELMEALEPFSYSPDEEEEPISPPGPPIWKYVAAGVLGVAALAVAGVMMFKPDPVPKRKTVRRSFPTTGGKIRSSER